jgi:hypothetical protein
MAKAMVVAKGAAEVKVVARIEQVKSPPRFLKPRRVALEARMREQGAATSGLNR